MRRGVMLAALAMGCASPEIPTEERLFDTVELVFTPVGGGTEVRATWNDPEGPDEPTADEAVIDASTDWRMAVELINARETPPVDANRTVLDSNWEYQLFFTGTAIEGPATGANPIAAATHSYADEDQTGLPLGLVNELTVRSAGRGSLMVRVQHFPLDNGSLTKVDELAQTVADSGLDALPGEAAGEVEFVLAVQ